MATSLQHDLKTDNQRQLDELRREFQSEKQADARKSEFDRFCVAHPDIVALNKCGAVAAYQRQNPNADWREQYFGAKDAVLQQRARTNKNRQTIRGLPPQGGNSAQQPLGRGKNQAFANTAANGGIDKLMIDHLEQRRARTGRGRTR